MQISLPIPASFNSSSDHAFNCLYDPSKQVNIFYQATAIRQQEANNFSEHRYYPQPRNCILRPRNQHFRSISLESI